ncbi:MAG: hypothetical protein KF684_02725 [Phycisphaeraceae bacterium]|nr:hypothetical protein [Phycisphaeraceae bacterium]
MTIPIRNIYYLLLYAWDALDASHLVRVGQTESPRVLDLLASIVEAGARHALKHGLDRGYVEHTERLAGIRGRLLLGESVRTMALVGGHAVCEIDELTHDILPNRILVTTLNTLRRVDGLDRKVRERIEETLRRMPPVTSVAISPRVFRSVRLHRNNRLYGLLMDACRLVHRCLLPTESGTGFRFRDFTRSDREMHRLFERFLFNFYRREQCALSVHSRKMAWFGVECSDHDRAFLPLMRTDLTLESPTRRVILDAKFYRAPLVQSPHGKTTVHPGHLRQIYAYLRNSHLSKPDGVVPEGIMLYAGVGAPVDLRYRIHGYQVRFTSIDLGAEWQEIHKGLLACLDETGERPPAPIAQ